MLVVLIKLPFFLAISNTLSITEESEETTYPEIISVNINMYVPRNLSEAIQLFIKNEVIAYIPMRHLLLSPLHNPS